MTASRSCFYTSNLVNQRSSKPDRMNAYLQLLCARHKVGRQSLHQAVQVHALYALQIDKIIAARKKGCDHQPENAAQTKHPGILSLAVLALSLLLQRVQLLGGDNAQIRRPFRGIWRCRRGFA